jgi:hypothetical protein
VVTATANGNRPRQETVTLEPGKPLPIEWTLPPAAAPVPKKEPTLPPPPPSSYFEDSAAWAKDGVWWIHKGADVGWMRDNQGVYLIEFQRQKSGIIKRTRHVDWVIDQRGPANRIEYSFDFANLERRVWVNGKETNKVKLPLGAASGDSFTIEIAITPEQIVIRDAKGNELDRYERPNRTLPLGKFGFKNDVALAIKRALER